MKHEEFSGARGLPHAPLAMPRQTLQRDYSWMSMLFASLLVWRRR